MGDNQLTKRIENKEQAGGASNQIPNNDPSPVNQTKKNFDDKSRVRARQRWKEILGNVRAVNAYSRSHHEDSQNEGRIEEIKKSKHRSKVKESVLSILKTQANLTEKVFERQKYSAKEMLIRKRAAGTKNVAGRLSLNRADIDADAIDEYNRQAEAHYKVTPDIREKLDKIRAKNEAAEEKRKAEEENPSSGLLSVFSSFLASTIIGQTLRANPRFYKMDPRDHLPDLCRRCRRPLEETLESRFTSIGILFCIFFPIIGILWLYGNREFVCVICEEVYVYGDLTARPEEEDDDDDLEEQRKN